ncbi:MAG: hypothetical protein ACREVG_00650 [Burkholderiales bacterium]
MKVALVGSSFAAACAVLAGCQNRVDEQRLKDLEGRVSTVERRVAAIRVGPSPAQTTVAPSSSIASVASASGVPAQDPASAEPVLIAQCKAEWPTNFEMQAYCQKQQRKAVAKLNRPFPLDLPAEVGAVIRSQCAQEWPDNYEMREYCEGQQIDGYRTARR